MKTVLIRKKINALVSGVLLMVVVLLLGSALWLMDDSTRSASYRDLRRTEEVALKALAEERRRLTIQATLVGALPILSASIRTEDVETINDNATSYKNQLGVPILDIFSADGRWLSSAGTKFVDADLPAVAPLLKAAEKGGSAQGPVVRGNQFAAIFDT